MFVRSNIIAYMYLRVRSRIMLISLENIKTNNEDIVACKKIYSKSALSLNPIFKSPEKHSLLIKKTSFIIIYIRVHKVQNLMNVFCNYVAFT